MTKKEEKLQVYWINQAVFVNLFSLFNICEDLSSFDQEMEFSNFLWKGNFSDSSNSPEELIKCLHWKQSGSEVKFLVCVQKLGQ